MKNENLMVFTGNANKDLAKKVASNLDLKLGDKGGGFMIWKPYFVKKKLDQIDFDDFLIFLDAFRVYL